MSLFISCHGRWLEGLSPLALTSLSHFSSILIYNVFVSVIYFTCVETSQHSAELSTSAEMSMNAFLNDNKTVCYLPLRTLHCDHLLRRRSYPEQLAAVENSGVSVRNNSVLSVRHQGPINNQ